MTLLAFLCRERSSAKLRILNTADLSVRIKSQEVAYFTLSETL